MTANAARPPDAIDRAWETAWAESDLDRLARRAQALTFRHFGRTVSLYVPLYLANYCGSGCTYCGFASDRKIQRSHLSPEELDRELGALADLGFEDVLLLTGERNRLTDVDFIRRGVAQAAERFSSVAIETFPMETEDYQRLAEAGCTSVTLYQETYDRAVYADVHRWGPKRDYNARRDAPARALAAGMRTVGLGVLFGLTDPLREAKALYRHTLELRKQYWQSGITLSFPRLRPEVGGFQAPHPVDERLLARLIFTFRILLPDVPLNLSTRERPEFRDGMAGLGVNRMSAASKTTVGGYSAPSEATGQFDIDDDRSVDKICAMLRSQGLEPVFKNWDAVYRAETPV